MQRGGLSGIVAVAESPNLTDKQVREALAEAEQSWPCRRPLIASSRLPLTPCFPVFSLGCFLLALVDSQNACRALFSMAIGTCLALGWVGIGLRRRRAH